MPKNFTLCLQKYRFGIRIQKNLFWIQDLFSHGSESGMENGSGIWDKHSGSATLHRVHMGGFTKELSRLLMLFAIEPIQYNATQLKMTAGREATQLYI